MKHWIWISFDLGVKGDYEGMYKWLDEHKAKESGDSVAGLTYEHSGDLIDELKTDLQEHVDFTSKSRVYVIRLLEGKMKGRFLFGGRRSAPSSGYAQSGGQEELGLRPAESRGAGTGMGESVPQSQNHLSRLIAARHSGVAHITGMAAHITGIGPRNEMMETK